MAILSDDVPNLPKKLKEQVRKVRGPNSIKPGKICSVPSWRDIFNELLEANEINISVTMDRGRDDRKRIIRLGMKGETKLRYVVAASMINGAVRGDYKCAMIVMDRSEGKVPTNVCLVDPEQNVTSMSDEQLEKIIQEEQHNNG